MASSSLLRSSTRPDYVCARCAFRASNASRRPARRWITQKYLEKVADAELAWGEKASRIRAGQEKSMLTILEERGLIHDFAGTRSNIDREMTNRRLGAYVGVDPTAPSLHVGHMIPFMSLFWMFLHGYHTVSLLGGATAKIGDPTGRLTTREKEHSAIGTANMANMHLQLKNIWINVEKTGRRYGYSLGWAHQRELVNNNAWWNSLPMLDVLKILGPGMRMGSMLARDTVKNKLSKGDGMSFAEFTYPIMQAWDWWYMFHTKGISMQIGGADQYGNITAGIDAVKYISTHHSDPKVRKEALAIGEPFGFTVPLLTTSSGQKFGKSAGNAVWLDSGMTSSFDLYKYFLATSDEDVGKYLKMFTFMALEDIAVLVKEHMTSPQQRKAQHKLARELVELVHGAEEARTAETQHHLTFKDPSALLAMKPAEGNKKPNAQVILPRHVIYQKSLPKILLAAGLVESTTEAYRLVEAGGAYIGSSGSGRMNDAQISWRAIKHEHWAPEKVREFLVHDTLLLLRRGKDTIKIVEIVSDEEYALGSGQFPGMTREWRLGVLRALSVMDHITSKDEARKVNIEKLIHEDESLLAAEEAERLKQDETKKEAKAKRLTKKARNDPSSKIETAKTGSKEETAAKDFPKAPIRKIDFLKKPRPGPGDDQGSWIDRL